MNFADLQPFLELKTIFKQGPLLFTVLQLHELIIILQIQGLLGK